MTDTDVLSIEYAPAPPILARPAFRRAIIVAITLLLIAAAAARWGGGAIAHARLLSLYRDCRHYHPSPSLVVYDDGPASAMKLLGSSNRYGSLTDSNGVGAVYRNDPWDPFYTTYSPPGRARLPVLFLGTRINARGERRLVVVEGLRVAQPDQRVFWLNVNVLWQTTPLSTPQMRASQDAVIYGLGKGELRWYAGQADTADPTHFILRYEINGFSRTIDGWLRDDDRVTLIERPANGP